MNKYAKKINTQHFSWIHFSKTITSAIRQILSCEWFIRCEQETAYIEWNRLSDMC